MGIIMSVEFYRESPGKFDSRTLSRWTGRIAVLRCSWPAAWSGCQSSKSLRSRWSSTIIIVVITRIIITIIIIISSSSSSSMIIASSA